MRKKGSKNKVYSAEFKIGVIMDMREHHLSYNETVRKYWDISRGQEHNYQKQILKENYEIKHDGTQCKIENNN